ncbi:MAG: c-type cytochrome [Gemmataceae bacterium]
MKHGVVLLFCAVCVACDGERERRAADMTGGDSHRGAQIILSKGCASCQTIPGISGANGVVGPPLNQIARRVYVAGVLVNNPDNMFRWLRDPPGVVTRTAMPNLNLTDAEIRDIACYLYTLD